MRTGLEYRYPIRSGVRREDCLPILTQTSTLWAMPTSYPPGVPGFVPWLLWNIALLWDQKQLTPKGLNEHQLWGRLFFCEPGNYKIQTYFSYTNWVGPLQVEKIGLKQGINQNNRQMWGTTRKGDGGLKGTDGFGDTKVCFWRRGRPKSKTHSWGWLLEDSAWPQVTSCMFLRGNRASGHYHMSPKWQSQQCVLLQGRSWWPLGLVHSQEVLCEPRGNVNPGLSPDSLTFRRLSFPISEQGAFWVFSPVSFLPTQLCIEG